MVDKCYDTEISRVILVALLLGPTWNSNLIFFLTCRFKIFMKDKHFGT